MSSGLRVVLLMVVLSLSLPLLVTVTVMVMVMAMVIPGDDGIRGSSWLLRPSGPSRTLAQ
jgi:hypothetical protein